MQEYRYQKGGIIVGRQKKSSYYWSIVNAEYIFEEVYK